jgi:hypothetical protein
MVLWKPTIIAGLAVGESAIVMAALLWQALSRQPLQVELKALVSQCFERLEGQHVIAGVGWPLR